MAKDQKKLDAITEARVKREKERRKQFKKGVNRAMLDSVFLSEKQKEQYKR